VIDCEKTGFSILRFKTFERFDHGLLATPYLMPALTGLLSLFRR